MEQSRSSHEWIPQGFNATDLLIVSSRGQVLAAWKEHLKLWVMWSEREGCGSCACPVRVGGQGTRGCRKSLKAFRMELSADPSREGKRMLAGVCVCARAYVAYHLDCSSDVEAVCFWDKNLFTFAAVDAAPRRACVFVQISGYGSVYLSSGLLRLNSAMNLIWIAEEHWERMWDVHAALGQVRSVVFAQQTDTIDELVGLGQMGFFSSIVSWVQPLRAGIQLPDL